MKEVSSTEERMVNVVQNLANLVEDQSKSINQLIGLIKNLTDRVNELETAAYDEAEYLQ
jgi:methyl-accepting chemotaxis protein